MGGRIVVHARLSGKHRDVPQNGVSRASASHTFAPRQRFKRNFAPPPPALLFSFLSLGEGECRGFLWDLFCSVVSCTPHKLRPIFMAGHTVLRKRLFWGKGKTCVLYVSDWCLGWNPISCEGRWATVIGAESSDASRASAAASLQYPPVKAGHTRAWREEGEKVRTLVNKDCCSFWDYFRLKRARTKHELRTTTRCVGKRSRGADRERQ